MVRAATRTVAFSVATVVYLVIGTVAIPAAIVKWLPHTEKVYLSVMAAMVVTGFLSILLAFWKEMVKFSVNKHIRSIEVYRYFLNISPYLFIGLFGAFSYLHYKTSGGFIHNGNETITFGRLALNDPLNWLLFVAENLSSAIFLDLMEAYKFKFSSIEYTTMLLGTVVFVFRLVVGVYFWKIIYNTLKYKVSRR